MLTKLFNKPQWQSKDPEVRKEALAQLSEEELAAVVPELARSDSSPEVRLVAVARLRSLDDLRSVQREDSDGTVREGASHRLRDLITGTAPDAPSLQDRLEALKSLDDPALTDYLARYAPDEAMRQAALGGVGRQRVLGEIAAHDDSPDIRLQALEKISSESVLERVLQEVRKKDKRTSHKAQQMLDEIRLKRGDAQTLSKRRLALCREAEAVVWKTGPAETARSLEEIVEEWKGLPSSPAEPELEHRFERICQVGGEAGRKTAAAEPMAEPTPEQAAPPSTPPAGDAPAPAAEEVPAQKQEQAESAPVPSPPLAQPAPALPQEALSPPLHKAVLCQQLDEQLDHLRGLERIDKSLRRQVKQLMEVASEAWKSFQPLDDAPAEQALQQRFSEVRHRLSERLAEIPVRTDVSDLGALCERVEQRLADPAPLEAKQVRRFQKIWQRLCRGLEEVPEAEASRFDQVQARLRDRFSLQAQELQSEVDQIRSALVETEKLLESGQLLPARSRHRKAAQDFKKLVGLSSRQRNLLRRRLSEVYFRIRELKDWQHWSNNQVRIRLCEQVEALPEMDLPPDELDRRIRAARNEWLQLESSEKLPTDSPHHASGPRLWRRFHAACSRAYQPCKEYFKEQAEKRQAVYEELVGICERTEAFLDQERQESDWKPIDGLIRLGARSLRRLNDIAPKQRGSMARRLRSNLGRLEKIERAIQKENESKKQSLIDQARELAETEDLDQAVQRVQELQSAWRNVGTTVRAREQELWKDFRAACGEVMNKRYKQRSAESQLQQDHYRQLADLCRQVERLSGRSVDALVDAEEDFQQAQQAWREADPHDSRLQQRFEQACRRFQQHLRGARHQQAQALRREQAQARHEALRQKAALCGEIEQARGLAAGEAQSQVESARERWDALTELDRATEKALRNRFEAACSALQEPSTDWDELEEKGRRAADLLCVRMEMLAGLDSPPESAQTRRQYQVSRLSAALSDREAPPDPRVEFEEIRRNFFLTGPLPEDACQPMQDRFEKAVKAFLSKSS